MGTSKNHTVLAGQGRAGQGQTIRLKITQEASTAHFAAKDAGSPEIARACVRACLPACVHARLPMCMPAACLPVCSPAVCPPANMPDFTWLPVCPPACMDAHRLLACVPTTCQFGPGSRVCLASVVQLEILKSPVNTSLPVGAIQNLPRCSLGKHPSAQPLVPNQWPQSTGRATAGHSSQSGPGALAFAAALLLNQALSVQRAVVTCAGGGDVQPSPTLYTGDAQCLGCCLFINVPRVLSA